MTNEPTKKPPHLLETDRGHGRQPREVDMQQSSDTRGIPAKYASSCPACGDRIEVDDLIALIGGVYVHVYCDDVSTPPKRTAPVCTYCFVERPCECDDL